MGLFRLIVLLISLHVYSGALAQDVFDAARQGDLKRLEQLYKLKPDTVNAVNEAGFPVLVIAGYHHQNEAVEFLLRHGANIHMDSPEGPVLLAAAYKGYNDLFILLLTYKPDVNASNELGTTALMYAAMRGNEEMVKQLLAAGAKKETKEKSGRTALYYAQLSGHEKLMICLKNESEP